VFDTWVSNARISDPDDPTVQQAPFNQQVKGVEVGLNGYLTRIWELTVNYTHLDDRITASSDPLSQGKLAPNTPHDAANLWSVLEPTAAVSIGAGATALSHRFADTENTARVPGYVVFNAMTVLPDQRSFQAAAESQQRHQQAVFHRRLLHRGRRESCAAERRAHVDRRPRATASRQRRMALDITSLTSLLSHWSAARVRSLFAQDANQAAPWVFALAREGLAAGAAVLRPHAAGGYRRSQGSGRGTALVSVRSGQRRHRGRQHGRALPRQRLGYPGRSGGGRGTVSARRGRRHAWAQYNLGHLYLDGRGVTRDFDQAYSWYLRAANQRHARAMNLVGRCCEQGWGTARDPAAAASWYQRSAEAGCFRGQYNWATLLLGQRRFDEAALWFERAASGGLRC
jgi:hypothetical protein